ncbi:FAD-dependent monooxygenase [Nucisporomicrobium flavum]|uniref:FAD-dependent monooxygenase n=1 Tax=Nucisporomicrobium flavum TaxID=2785915 RepID=UPI0018F3A712|nr:FAD-dependent monooxygenase [Nucisporomicrobium flavum]
MLIDVVVVGGGPVGLMLAAELRLGGATVTVIEKLPDTNPHSRAFRLQPRTLDILDARGLLEEFRRDNLSWPKAHFAGLSPLLDLSAIDSEHAYSLLIPQARTERLLEAHARAAGAEIRRGQEVLDLRQNDDHVVSRVRDGDTEYELRSRYVVGCDGGGSTVRKLTGIEFPGTTGTVSALLGDVILDEPEKLPAGIPGTMRTPNGLLMAVALEDSVTRILTTTYDVPHADRHRPVTLDELMDSVRTVTGQEVRMNSPRWLSRFSDTTRLAERYRDRRVLLAGDAAHVHFPIGAQGLNLGLQDAMNLGWKLAAEVTGRAPQGLLDSYDRERRPVARAVLRETQAQVALMNPDERINPLRELIGQLLALDAVNLFLSRLVGGTSFRYTLDSADADQHPLTGEYAPAMTVSTPEGDRRIAELLRPGRGLLLLLGEPLEAATVAEIGQECTVVTGDPVEKSDLRALLLRPDGHVAWAASAETDEAALRASLSTAWAAWFGQRARSDA